MSTITQSHAKQALSDPTAPVEASSAPPPFSAAFKRLGWSNLCAQFSEQIALSAAALTAVFLLKAGPAETGWLQAAQTLPFLLLSIPAGLVADRASRRMLMVGSEALRTASLLAILLLLGFGRLNLLGLSALGFVGAIGTVCYSVAAPALVPSLVPQARLSDANRWLELARSAAFAAGPALGGALVGWTGAPVAYALATALSLSAVALLLRLPQGEKASPIRRNLLQDLREGAGFMARHALLRPVLITAVFFNLSWFVILAIYVAYAVETLGLSATEVGLTLGIYGVGMIAGALAAPALARRMSFGTMVVIGPSFGFLAAAVMLATVWVPSVFLVSLGFFLFGAGPILWTISTVTLRQAVTPNALLGRVSAFVMTATFGARPLGAALGAFIATQFGVSACLSVATVGFALQLWVICVSPVRALKAIPDQTWLPQKAAA